MMDGCDKDKGRLLMLVDGSHVCQWVYVSRTGCSQRYTSDTLLKRRYNDGGTCQP